MPHDPTHPVFRKPANENAALWRYMDFAKYVALLESSALYFARADTLGDPFEGSMTKMTRPLREMAYLGQGLPREKLEAFLHQQEETSRLSPLTHFVNCWHEAEYESEAMWKLYLSSDQGIAIRTTYAKLSESLQEATHLIYIGEVEYIDYDSAAIPEGNAFWPFMHKRLSLSHEREVRAITSGFVRHVYQRWSFDAEGVRDELLEEGRRLGVELDPSTLEPPSGLLIPVSLDALVESIYVAPGAPEWFLGVVESVTRRYERSFPIEQSRLGEDPIY